VGRLDAGVLFGGRGGTAVIGAAGEVLDECTSTNDVARERLRAGVPDGYVVASEYQGAGRGRQGGWVCPPGKGILLSVVLRIRLPARERRLLTILGAVAAAEAVRSFGVPARIKWPNDIVIASHRRGTLRIAKLGGVLVEAEVCGDSAPAHVLGVGINVNMGPGDLPTGTATPATSMQNAAGASFRRSAVARALLTELDGWYRRIAAGQSEMLLARWRRRSCLVGCQVRAEVGRRVVAGTVRGVRSSGELILEVGQGERLLLSDSRARLLP